MIPQTFDVCLEHTTLNVFNTPKTTKSQKKNQDDTHHSQRSKLLQNSTQNNFPSDEMQSKQGTCTTTLLVSLQEMFLLFVISCLCIGVWQHNQKFSLAQSMNICILIMTCNSQISTATRYILCVCTVISVTLTPDVFSTDRISVFTLFVLILYDVCIFLRHHKQSALMTSLAAFCIATSICATVCSYIFVDPALGVILDGIMITSALVLSVPNVY